MIFHYVHCAPLSIFNLLTQPFCVVLVIFSESRNMKMIDILQKDKVIVMIFATLVTGAISDDRLKKKNVLSKLF